MIDRKDSEAILPACGYEVPHKNVGRTSRPLWPAVEPTHQMHARKKRKSKRLTPIPMHFLANNTACRGGRHGRVCGFSCLKLPRKVI